MPKITRPAVAEIDLRLIAANLKAIKRKVGPSVKILGVVKANAYGHGMVEVSRFISNGLVDSLGVATAEEGVILRNTGLRKPILVFTLPSEPQVKAIVQHGLEATVCSPVEARTLQQEAERRRRKVAVHLKIETGMNRIGITPSGLPVLLKSLSHMKRLEIVGVYTHFAQADIADKSYTHEQLSRFTNALDILKTHGIEPEVIHTANSAGILDLPESHFTMVRPGIMMYGYYPSEHVSRSVRVKPALTLSCKVSFVKRIEAGETVSYGRLFKATAPAWIATLPIGYADGYFRLLTGKSAVLIKGKKHPVAGRICMDQIMVDLGDVKIAVGEKAILIGSQGACRIDASDLSSLIGTIPYEILTNISSRVPRTYLPS
ncbi:MAG: alanine racemase [bacterium]